MILTKNLAHISKYSLKKKKEKILVTEQRANERETIKKCFVFFCFVYFSDKSHFLPLQPKIRPGTRCPQKGSRTSIRPRIQVLCKDILFKKKRLNSKVFLELSLFYAFQNQSLEASLSWVWLWTLQKRPDLASIRHAAMIWLTSMSHT